MKNTILVLALLSALPLSAGWPNPDEWPVGHNVNHTGFSATTLLKPPLRIRWVVNVAGLCTGEGGQGPVVAENKVVFRGYNQNLFCLDAGTGELLWRNQVLAPEFPVHPMGSHLNVFYPCLWNNRAYAVFQVKGNPDSNGIRCFNLTTGEQLWRRDAGSIVSVRLKDGPQITKGRLFLHSVRDVTRSTLAQNNYCYKAQVQAWDAMTGDTLWTFTMAETLDVARIHSNNDNVSYNTALCVSADTIFASFGDDTPKRGRTAALDLNGNLLWSNTQEFVDGYVGEVQYTGGLVLVNGAKYALNPTNGKLVYASSAAPYGKIAAVMNNRFWSRGYAEAPRALNLNTGAEILRSKLNPNDGNESGCSAPRAANGYVYSGMGNPPAAGSPLSVGHTLFAWDEQGNPAWWFRSTENVCQDVTIAYDRVYWLTNEWQKGVGPGLVYCFENDPRAVASLRAFCVPETLEQHANGEVKAVVTFTNGDRDTTTMACYFAALDTATAMVTVSGTRINVNTPGMARVRVARYGLSDTIAIPVVPTKSGLDTVMRINFQASPWAYKYGWLADIGAAYSSVRGYGWTNRREIQVARDDRGGNNFLFASFVKTSMPTGFRINLPDGDYLIRIGMGDRAWGSAVYDWTALGSDTLCRKPAGLAGTAVETRVVRVAGDSGLMLTVSNSICYLVIGSASLGVTGLCAIADDGYTGSCALGADLAAVALSIPFGVTLSPNPVSTVCRFALSLPSKAMVRLSVYDSRGRLIVPLADETRNAGVHHFNWNGADRSVGRVAPGIYFLKGRVGKTEIRKSLLLIR